ncbi:hypothetical protein [Corynebacterium sp. A21]|uniref:hypothetical protein n=1 Tax=Corynebacterium sp. A21 TaxID=3457318 RepID=UPI003FCF881C
MTEPRPNKTDPAPVWSRPGSGVFGHGLGIFFAILLVTALAMAATYLVVRETLLQQVAEQANIAVENEIEQFVTFSEEATDPQTGNSFGASTRLLDVYLATRIPEPDEALAGLVDDRVIQMNRGDSTRRLEPDSSLVLEISNSAAAAGVIEPPAGEKGASIHWGKVHLSSAKDPRPAAFVVVHHTDADHADLAATSAVLRSTAVTAFGGAAVLALILSLVLGWQHRRRAMSGTEAPSPAIVDVDKPSPEVNDPNVTHRATLRHTGEEMRAPLQYLNAAAAQQPTLAPHVRQLQQVSESLGALSQLLQPGTVGEDLPIDSGELTWQLVQRLRQDSGLAVRLASTATGQEVSVNPEQLRIALGEAIQAFSPGSLGSTEGIEFGTTFRGDGSSRALSLWVRDRGESARPAAPTPVISPLIHAVAAHHGGRAWVESVAGLGALIGIDLPLSGPLPQR